VRDRHEAAFLACRPIEPIGNAPHHLSQTFTAMGSSLWIGKPGGETRGLDFLDLA
jgi:hypothetical protein